jgi:hypothetical protein
VCVCVVCMCVCRIPINMIDMKVILGSIKYNEKIVIHIMILPSGSVKNSRICGGILRIVIAPK